MKRANVSRVLNRWVLPAGIMATAAAASAVHADWPQWGGPNRDFSVAKASLAEKWPEEGPRRLWRRDLGEGYSSIIAQDGVLYTMYRTGKTPHEFTIALDAKTGETIWETKHDSPIPADMKAHPGPHSTPLLSEDRLFSVGRNAVLRCYDKKDGRLLWERDLRTDYGSKYSQWGYSPSPIAYGDLVIVPVGRKRPNFEGGTVPENAEEIKNQEAAAEGRTLMAFSQTDGRLVWKSEDEGIDHTSPILMNVNGQDQLILPAPEALLAVAPETGKLLWRHRCWHA